MQMLLCDVINATIFKLSHFTPYAALIAQVAIPTYNNKNRPLSSSLAPSPFSYFFSLLKNPNPNPMEEVWNDITLSSLHNPRATFRPTNLQDFLARPFSLAAVPSPPPITATALSSNSINPDDHFGKTHQPIINNNNNAPPNVLSSFNVPFVDVLASPPGDERKRLPETFRNSSNPRHKRMIKNRESAARSRARKQENISLSLSNFIEKKNITRTQFFYKLSFTQIEIPPLK